VFIRPGLTCVRSVTIQDQGGTAPLKVQINHEDFPGHCLARIFVSGLVALTIVA